MSKFCPKCFYIGKGKFDILHNFFTGNIFLGACIIGAGLSFILNQSNDSVYEKISHFGGYLFICFGVYNIKNYFSGTDVCPKCNNKEMLPLDNPEAINLIKKYDLTLGENPSPNTQNEPSPDSLETPMP